LSRRRLVRAATGSTCWPLDRSAVVVVVLAVHIVDQIGEGMGPGVAVGELVCLGDAVARPVQPEGGPPGGGF
jgi:hypothetical protein